FVLTTRADLSDTAVDRAMQTQLLIVTSPRILQPVADETGVSVQSLTDEVSAAMEGRTSVMQITVADRDQRRAVTIARAVADAYVIDPDAAQPAATGTGTAGRDGRRLS